MNKYLASLTLMTTLMTLNACQSVPPDPVQTLYDNNQTAQQVRAQQQAMQDGLNRYHQQNQSAAQRANSPR